MRNDIACKILQQAIDIYNLTAGVSMSDKGKATISFKEMKSSFSQPDTTSQLIEKEVITLKTNPSKHTLGWSYEPVSRAFSEIFIYSHARLEDHERGEKLTQRGEMFRKDVRSNLEKVMLGINTLTSKWEQDLADHEYKINDNYTNPVEVEFTISTPEERQFLKMIESFDYFLIILDNLWHCQEQSMEDKQRVTGKVAQRISGLVTNARKKASTLRRIRLNQSDDAQSDDDQLSNTSAETEKVNA